jgi:hypothetical protein
MNPDSEKSIALYGKNYPLKIDIAFLKRFEAETGKDFNALALYVINSRDQCAELDPLSQRQAMADAISMTDCAWAFFLAAKGADRCVTLEEIEDAVWHEGVIPREREEGKYTESYPIKFYELCVYVLDRQV